MIKSIFLFITFIICITQTILTKGLRFPNTWDIEKLGQQKLSHCSVKVLVEKMFQLRLFLTFNFKAQHKKNKNQIVTANLCSDLLAEQEGCKAGCTYVCYSISRYQLPLISNFCYKPYPLAWLKEIFVGVLL